MLRSTHLQPGINLNPISFPSADLTLKVFKFQFNSNRTIYRFTTNKNNGQFHLSGLERNIVKTFKARQTCFFLFRWSRRAKRGKTLSPCPSRAPLAEFLPELSLPAALAPPVVLATVPLGGFPCLRCLLRQ